MIAIDPNLPRRSIALNDKTVNEEKRKNSKIKSIHHVVDIHRAHDFVTMIIRTTRRNKNSGEKKRRLGLTVTSIRTEPKSSRRSIDLKGSNEDQEEKETENSTDRSIELKLKSRETHLRHGQVI